MRFRAGAVCCDALPLDAAPHGGSAARLHYFEDPIA
jgi:hypothetical protein